MRALQVICIVIGIIALLLFGLFALSSSAIEQEVKNIDSGKPALAKEVTSGGETKYDFNGTQYTLEEYKNYIGTANNAIGPAKTITGAATLICVVGAIGFGIGAGKKKRQMMN